MSSTYIGIIFELFPDTDDSSIDCSYGNNLQTKEQRQTFAQTLRDALRKETSSITTVSDDSSYALGIHIAGSGLDDHDIK